MTAVYYIEIYEPWTGALVTGSFRRWVQDAQEAEQVRIKNEKALAEKYDGAVITLIEVI